MVGSVMDVTSSDSCIKIKKRVIQGQIHKKVERLTFIIPTK